MNVLSTKSSCHVGAIILLVHISLTCNIKTKTVAKANGENKQAFTKKYVLYSFGLKMILPYERTVVTSCMQITKTPQAQWEMATDCFMVCIYRYGNGYFQTKSKKVWKLKSKNALVSTVKMLFIISKQPTEPSCTHILQRRTKTLSHTYVWLPHVVLHSRGLESALTWTVS